MFYAFKNPIFFEEASITLFSVLLIATMMFFIIKLYISRIRDEYVKALIYFYIIQIGIVAIVGSIGIVILIAHLF